MSLVSILNEKIAHQKSSVTPDTVINSAVVEVVTAKTFRSTDVRHTQLRGKKIIVVCCGLDGLDSKRFAFLRAQELGIRVFLLEDATNTLAVSLEEEGLVEHFIRVDMTQRPSLLNDVLRAIQGFQAQRGISFDGVCTFWADAVTLGVRIQDALGTPGNSVRAVDIAHNKNLTREVMRHAGFPTPKTMLITCLADAEKAVEVVGAPGIMKPVTGAASLGVQKVETVEGIVPMYKRELETMKELYSEGELMGIFFGKDGGQSAHHLVYEEFLEGDEVDVDIILHRGEVAYAVVADDWPQIQPWFAEMGNNCPSILPKQQQDALRDMAAETLLAMGFTTGVFHVELKNTPAGPRLIEVNPRMGGGPVWRMHKLAYGVDLIAEQFCASCGIPTTPAVPKAPMKYVSCGEKFFEKSMETPQELRDVVNAMKHFPNVVEAVPLVRTNEHIVGIEDGFPTRTARFVVLADSAIEAQEYARKLLEVCEIPEPIRVRQLAA